MTQLETLLDRAWSFGSREGWGKEDLKTEYAGTVQSGRRIYDIYTDTEGNAWYRVRVLTEYGPVPEYEAIFGTRERKRGGRRDRKDRRRTE